MERKWQVLIDRHGHGKVLPPRGPETYPVTFRPQGDGTVLIDRAGVEDLVSVEDIEIRFEEH